MEKDEKLEEFQSKIDDLNCTLKDIGGSQADSNYYSLITWNNALRTNLKQKDKEIELVKADNKKLMKVINLINFDSKELKVKKELLIECLDNKNTNVMPENVKAIKHRAIKKIKNLMKLAWVSAQDIAGEGEGLGMGD